MNCYQLACGHWQSDYRGYGIGGLLGCIRCNTLRTVVIGMSGSPQFAATGEAA